MFSLSTHLEKNRPKCYTIFTPIISALLSDKTSELLQLSEAAIIILPKFLAETHNHQAAAWNHLENQGVFLYTKIGIGSPERRMSNSAVQVENEKKKGDSLPLFSSLFTSSQGEKKKTCKGSVSDLRCGTQYLRDPELIFSVPKTQSQLFSPKTAHPLRCWGPSIYPSSIVMLLMEKHTKLTVILSPPWA